MLLAALILAQSSLALPLPEWDVDRSCGAMSPREAKFCVETEQSSYEMLKGEWPRLTDSERERVRAAGDRATSYRYTMAHRLGEGLLQVDAFHRKVEVPRFQR